MGANIWEQLSTSFKFSDVVLILLLCVALVIGVIKGWQELLKLLNLETRREREKREYEETIEELNSKITSADDRISKLEASAKKFNDDRVHDREQSYNYQHEYMDIVGDIYAKQDAILEKVDALAEQSRKYQLADMRETLLQAYRYYTNEATNKTLCWSEIEQHAFEEQYNVYVQNGGNGYIQNTVKNDMDKLRVIPLTDYEGMAELMAGRTHSKC